MKVTTLLSFNQKSYSFGAKKLKDISYSDFINNGGVTKFNSAVNKDSSPYNGNIITENGEFTTISKYENGQKSGVKVSLKTRNNYSCSLLSTNFDFSKKQVNPDGSVSVYYTTDNQTCDYEENYTPSGNLKSVKYQKYKRKQVEIPSFAPNRSVYTYVPTDEVLSSVFAEFYTDGVSLKSFKIDSLTNIYGNFTTKIINYSDKGTVLNKTLKEKTTLYKDFIIENEISKFDENGNFLKSEGKNCYYYNSLKNEIPYAYSDKIITKPDGNNNFVQNEYGWKVLDKNGGNIPIIIYGINLHPNTIRQHKGNTIVYYDGDTKKKYAYTKLNANKNPIKIVDTENGVTTNVFYKADNAIAKKYDKNGKLLSTAAYAYNKYNYELINIEYFDNSGKTSKVETYCEGKLHQISSYKDGKVSKKTKFFSSGKIHAEAYFTNGKMDTQIVYEKDNTKRIILYFDKGKSEENVFSPNGEIISTTTYIDKLATKRELFNSKGNLTETILYQKGIPDYSKSESKKRIVLNDDNF